MNNRVVHHGRLTLRKTHHIIWNRLKRDVVSRMRAHVVGTDMSDAAFSRALDDRFATSRAFLDHMPARKESRFFLGPSRQGEFIAAIRACCPESEALTIAAADTVCEHIFDLLGSGPTHLGGRVDWHVDFKSRHHYNRRQHYSAVRAASFPGGHDIKVPWELSRCQHYAWLGQAYWLTGDEVYAEEFASHVFDWTEQNRPQFGVNWASTMDVAIRAVNWLWGYYFFQDSPSLTDEFRFAFFKSLLVHGRHIKNNLEWSEAFTGNHYLSNVVGLVYLGILLPEFEEAREWREFGMQELENEMFKQVYPDGVDFEASVSYHRLVTELFLSAVLLAQFNGHTFSQAFLERLEKMVAFVMNVTKPDGTVPLIGDNDNGRLHRLKVWTEPKREWNDFRYLLAIGAVFFDREDFARAAGDQWEEAVWFFGERALALKQAVADKGLPPLQLPSRNFPDAGTYIMRHDDMYLVVDSGPVGQNGNGGHAHNDTLSFELYANGRTWIVDPGTYVYTPAYDARNTFRSTASHNTIMVAGQEQNRFSAHELFRLSNDARPRVVRWEDADTYILFIGEQDGYGCLPGHTVLRRTIFLDREERLVIIRDSVSSDAPHICSSSLHFAPNLKVESLGASGPGLRVTDHTSRELILLPLGTHPEATVESDWVSPSYGVKQRAKQRAGIGLPILSSCWPYARILKEILFPSGFPVRNIG